MGAFVSNKYAYEGRTIWSYTTDVVVLAEAEESDIVWSDDLEEAVTMLRERVPAPEYATHVVGCASYHPRLEVYTKPIYRLKELIDNVPLAEIPKLVRGCPVDWTDVDEATYANYFYRSDKNAWYRQQEPIGRLSATTKTKPPLVARFDMRVVNQITQQLHYELKDALPCLVKDVTFGQSVAAACRYLEFAFNGIVRLGLTRAVRKHKILIDRRRSWLNPRYRAHRDKYFTAEQRALIDKVLGVRRKPKERTKDERDRAGDA